MWTKLKHNLILIFSILVVLSPIVYLNRQLLGNMVILTQDNFFPLKPGSVPWLTTQGKNILDDKGQVVLLRGVNIASNQWSPGYKRWHPSAVKEVTQNWHANVIRTRVFENDYIDNPFVFFRDLETEIIRPARQTHTYVILHPWLGENNSLPTKYTKRMWTAIAKRYKNDPTIIYDILAEPRGISFMELKTAYNDLIPAIRTVNPKALIMVTGLDWGRDINAWESNPLPYSNIVYRTNPYNKRGELEGYFLRLVDKYPVFLGEYGTSDDLTMTLPDVNYLLKLANSYNLGWTAWNFSATGCHCLLTNESNFIPSEYGQQVLNTLKDPSQVLDPLPQPNLSPGKFFIYSDFLDNGFTDFSWDILRDLVSTEKVYQGKQSLKADFKVNGGLYLHSVREIQKTPLGSLHMVISTPRIKQLTLKFRTSEDTMSDPVVIADYAISSNNGWYVVNVPLKLMPFPSFSSLMIEPANNNSPIGVIYLDEVFVE